MNEREAGSGFEDRASSLAAADVVHFEAISDLAYARAGLVIAADKVPMVLARVGKRMRSLGIASLAEYRNYLDSDPGAEERNELVYALTTNVTSFMREAHHFEFIRDRILSPCIERARAGARIRFWSAGCSTGQEPYSLAMLLLDRCPEASKYDIRILATDIDPYVLQTAREARYSEEVATSLPDNLRSRFLAARTDRNDLPLEVDAEVRRLVTFRELNLLAPWPMRRPFDLVLCRNVVIYFDRKTQIRLWRRFHDALHPGGHLMLGHSERLDPDHARSFRTVGTTIYQKPPVQDLQPEGGP